MSRLVVVVHGDDRIEWAIDFGGELRSDPKFSKILRDRYGSVKLTVLPTSAATAIRSIYVPVSSAPRQPRLASAGEHWRSGGMCSDVFEHVVGETKDRGNFKPYHGAYLVSGSKTPLMGGCCRRKESAMHSS